MVSNDKTKPVSKRAGTRKKVVKEPTIEELLTFDYDAEASKTTTQMVSKNTSILYKIKDVKEMTSKKKEEPKKEEIKEETIVEEELSKKEKKKLAKEEKKKNKRKFRKGEKLFILLNLVIIFYIIGFYANRAIYYHKKLNLDIVQTTTLKEVITNIKNVTFSGDGLYQDDENKVYYYKGKDVKNYAYFQGRLWRIISISDTIKMIEAENMASIVAGIGNEYKDSNLRVWLDDYRKTIKDSESYLDKTKWCNKAVDVKDYKCDEKFEDDLGLLTIDDYIRAGADSSYIPIEEYFWTMNYNENKEFYYINEKGQINNNVNDKENYFSMGLRPVISLSTDVLFKQGTGSIEHPYIIGEVGNALLKDNYVGCFVKYNDMDFRIISADETGTELILNSVIEDKVSYSNYNTYLNKNFVNKFDQTKLVKMDSYNYKYNFNNKYNYKEVNPNTKVSSYVRIPNIGDYYTTEYGDYWLNNIFDTNLKLYSVILENNTYFSDLSYNSYSLRPIIKIEPNMVIESGIGTFNDPILIGEQNVKEKE